MNQTKKKYKIIGIIAVVFVVWLICISVILVKQFKTDGCASGTAGGIAGADRGKSTRIICFLSK